MKPDFTKEAEALRWQLEGYERLNNYAAPNLVLEC